MIHQWSRLSWSRRDLLTENGQNLKATNKFRKIDKVYQTKDEKGMKSKAETKRKIIIIIKGRKKWQPN